MRNLNSSVRPVGEFITPPGDRLHVQYEPRFDGQTLRVVAVGSYDAQAEIEAYAPYCDINYMLSQLKLGDTSVLSNRPALYGDFSGCPDNPIDAINLVHSAERRFAQLDTETKASYNNDYRVWLADMLGSSDTPHDLSAPVPSDSVTTDDVVGKDGKNES